MSGCEVEVENTECSICKSNRYYLEVRSVCRCSDVMLKWNVPSTNMYADGFKGPALSTFPIINTKKKRSKNTKKQNMYADFQKPSRLKELKTLRMFEGLTDKTVCPHPQLIYLTWTK
jgi:hypothetical protein